MKINFRKIASVLASTAMLSSTLALAAAANYPAPFVQNGNADVAVVYGSLPGAEFDLASVTTITGNLQAKLSAQSSSSGSSTTTSTSGETFPLFTSSTKIYLNNSANVVRSTLTETELATILEDGSFSGNVDADFIQTITMGANPRVVYDKLPTSDDDPSFGIQLGTNANTQPIYNATVTFDRAVNFTNSDSEGEELTLFGQKFTVGSATDDDELVLYKSSETATLTLGGSAPSPSTSVTVDGATYTIDLISASDTDATVKVTNAAGVSDTKKINEASSKTVNGLEVAINIADESDATNTAFAEITVGAEKIILQSGSEVKVGSDEDAVEGTSVTFTGSVDDITKITLAVAASDSDEDAIVAGGSFVDPVFGTFKVNFAGMTIPANSSDREKILIKASGNDKMTVNLATHKDDAAKTITFINNETAMVLGDSDRDIFVLPEMAPVNKSQYTLLGNEDDGYLVEVTAVTNATSGYDNDKVEVKDVFTGDTYEATLTAEGSGTITVGGRSYSVTYTGASDLTERARFVQFNDPDTSSGVVNVLNTLETSKGAKVGFYTPITLNLSNVNNVLQGDGTSASTLKFPNGDGYTSITVSKNSTDGAGWIVNSALLNTSSNATSVVISAGALAWNISTTSVQNQTSVKLNTPDSNTAISLPALFLFEEEDDLNNEESIVVRFSGYVSSSTPIQIAGVDLGWQELFVDRQSESNDDIYTSMDFFGSIVTEDRADSDQYVVTISYPDEQVNALLYAGELNSAVTSTGSGSGVKELGSVHVKDTEFASVSSKNLIVVGGSCVNTLAKELLGGAACGSDFEQKTGVGAGSFLIQSFSRTGGKVATLVAGYSAADTEAGAKVLTTQTVDTTVGKKYKGSGTTVAMVDTTSA